MHPDTRLLTAAREEALVRLKEPAYRSGAPKHALFVFGLKARFRVWVVLDGETLYLDRNGDGDLTGREKGFSIANLHCRDVELCHPDGETRYIVECIAACRIEGQAWQPILAGMDVRGKFPHRLRAHSTPSDQPENAPILHFRGPLTVGMQGDHWSAPSDAVLHTGSRPAELTCSVGSRGPDHDGLVMVGSAAGGEDYLPRGMDPVMDIEFPPKMPGGRAVRQRYILDYRC
jgi:hypothetical protein